MNTNFKDDQNLIFKEEIFKISGCAMTVLNTLGHGFAEKIYENALAVEFQLQGIDFTKQPSIAVSYKNVNIGTYSPDFIVFNEIIVELKTIPSITNIEQAQVLNYLKSTNLRLGLILNFKNPKLEWKRIVL